MQIKIKRLNTQANEEFVKEYNEKDWLTGKVKVNDNYFLAPNNYKLFIKYNAVREIFEFIEWDVGLRSDMRDEQGGILLGKRFYDETLDIHYAIVSKAINAKGARGSTGYLEITHDCWCAMHKKREAYIKETGDDVVIVGWYHTHPNSLPVFMSGTDRNTQSDFFDGKNTYSIVINPQRHLIKVFRSNECFPVQAYFVFEDSK